MRTLFVLLVLQPVDLDMNQEYLQLFQNLPEVMSKAVVVVMSKLANLGQAVDALLPLQVGNSQGWADHWNAWNMNQALTDHGNYGCCVSSTCLGIRNFAINKYDVNLRAVIICMGQWFMKPSWPPISFNAIVTRSESETMTNMSEDLLQVNTFKVIRGIELIWARLFGI